MTRFQDIAPSTDSYWRAIILFGRNSASYKFALAKSLLEVCGKQKTFLTLEELAEPFALQVCQHLEVADRQGNRPTGPFLDACRKYNSAAIDIERLRSVTVSRGFDNVIDAFHAVEHAVVPVRFFVDERKRRNGITITDDLLGLKGNPQYENLSPEVEARWRLVETSWELGISRNLLSISVDDAGELLYVPDARLRRAIITSSRDALDGYQKGRCFYCFRDIAISPGAENLADVDHFFPRSLLRGVGAGGSLDGIWNLVLACQTCNRGGETGKFARLPEVRYLERLHTRNTFLIESHHPLRETLIQQTGFTPKDRVRFLQNVYTSMGAVPRWSPKEEMESVF